MITVLRERKDGCGCSECSSPDDLVGKGRCVHVLSDSQSVMHVNQVERGLYKVEIDKNSLTIKGQEEALSKFFSTLGSLKEEDVRKIIEILES